MKMGWIVLCLLVGLSALPGQVVINEFNFDDSGADNLEFVELYNAGPAAVSIGNWVLEAGDFTSTTVVTIPGGTMLAAGDYYVVGDGVGGVPNVDLQQASGWLQNGEDSIALRNDVGVIMDAVGYETNKGVTLFIEGNGWWGNFTGIEGTGMQSISRAADGLDNNDNGRDFVILRWTPGATNTPTGAYPFCDDFEGRAPDTAVAGWAGSFALPTIVNPLVSSGGLVNPLSTIGSGPSPDGGNCMVTWDPAGGGNMVFLDSPPVADMTVEAYVFFYTGETGTEFHTWAVGVRGTTGTFFNAPALGNANGNTGLAWRYHSEGPGGPAGTGGGATLLLVDEGDGSTFTEVILASIPIVAGTNDGWQRLRLSVTGANYSANFGGSYGVPTSGTVFSGTTASAQLGTCYIGVREGVVGTTTAYPILLDRLEVTVPGTSCIPRYQTNSPASTLVLDGEQGGIYNRAISTQCFGGAGVLTLSTTNVGFPWDAGIALVPLQPRGGGAVVTPAGQIINLAIFSAPVSWINGGVAPDFTNFSFPASTFSINYNAFPSPGGASIQMGVVDPTGPDGIAVSAGAELNTLPSNTILGPLGDDVSLLVDLAGASPLCAPGPGIPFYGTVYTQMFVVSNGRIMFGGADIDFSPTVVDALADSPFVGVWTDLRPDLQGTITTSVTPVGNIRIDFVNCQYTSGSINTATFGIEFDQTGGGVMLDGLGGVSVDSFDCFLGICGGTAVGATDPGPTVFGPAPNVGITGNGTDALYDFGPVGTLAPGVSSIQFVPNAFGNYDWISN